MNFEKVTYEAEKMLLNEISKEKKFLTFKKLVKIFELDALLKGRKQSGRRGSNPSLRKNVILAVISYNLRNAIAVLRQQKNNGPESPGFSVFFCCAGI